MADPGKSVILGIEYHDTAAAAMGILDLERRIEIIDLPSDVVAIRFKAIEELADVIMSLMLCVSEFWVRPDLSII